MTRRPTQSQIAAQLLAQAPDREELQSRIPWAKYRKQNKKRESPEEDFQIECVKLLRSLHILTWSTPNHLWGGASPNKNAFLGYMEKQKRMGLLRGVTDLGFMFVNIHNTLSMCFFECKAGYNKPTDEQQEFMDKAKSCGAYVGWGTKIEDLRSLLREAGHPLFNN